MGMARNGMITKAGKGSRARGNGTKRFTSRPHGKFTNPKGSSGRNTRGGKGGAFGSNPGSVSAARQMVRTSGKVKTRWARG